MTLVHDKLLANLHLETFIKTPFNQQKRKISTPLKKKQQTSNRQPADKISKEVLCSIRCELEDGGREGGGGQGPIHLLGSPGQASLEAGLTSGDIGGKYFSCLEKPSRWTGLTDCTNPGAANLPPAAPGRSGEERRGETRDLISSVIR